MSKYSSTVAEKAPAAYWRMNDIAAIMVDAMGMYDGAYNNAPSYGMDSPIVGDADGGSVGFNGTNEGAFAVCPPISTGSFAVEVWMKATSYNTGNGGAALLELAGSTSYPNDRTVVLELQTDQTLRFLVRDTTSRQIDAYTTMTFDLNKWYHIFAIKVLGRTYLYVDGRLQGTNSGSTAIDLSLMTDVNIAQSGRDFAGQLCELAVYTDERSVHDAFQHYLIARRVGANFAGQIARANPKWWYRLSDTVGTLTAKDEMSNSIGTYYNAPTLGEPSALSDKDATTSTGFLGASNQYVSLSDTANNYGAADFSMGVWFKTNSSNISQNIATNYNGSTGWLLSVNPSNQFSLDGRWLAGNYQSFDSIQTVADGLWHYGVAVHYGVIVELWIDGVLDSVHTTLANGCPSNLNIAIGTYGNSPQLSFDGNLHDFALYDRRLTSGEIAHQYQSGAGNVSVSYDDAILNDAPVAYWKMDDVTTTMFDAAPYGLNGTHTSVTYAQPPAFSDSTASIKHTSSNSLGPVDSRFQNSKFSVSVWVKPDAASLTAYSYIVGQQTGTSGSKFALTMSSYGGGGINGHARIWITTNGADAGFLGVDSTVQMLEGVWYNIVVTYDGTRALLYINGLFDVALDVVSPVSSLDQIRFGNSYDNTLPLRGSIDSGAYYDYPLSPEQINRHYEMAQNSFNVNPDYEEFIKQYLPVSYWRMNEAGTTENDLIGLNHLSTTFGAPVRSQSELAYNLNSDSTQFTGVDKFTSAVPPVLDDYWSAEFWVKNDNPGATYSCVLDADGLPSAVGYIGFNLDKPMFFDGSAQVSDSNWYSQIIHVVMVCNNNVGSFYINGEYDGSFTGSPTFVPETIGADTTDSEPLTGYLQDVVLYDYPLTAGEARDHYLKGIMDGKFNSFGFTGNTKINGVEGQCTVRVYNRGSGQLIGQALSDNVTGDYIIDNLDENVDYDLLCFDGVGICPQASGPLQPVELE